MKDYTPKPGSLPARIVEHLQAVGGTMTRSEICNAFAIRPKDVHSNLATPIKHGVLVMYQAEGVPTAYGLPGATVGSSGAPVPAHLTLGSVSRYIEPPADKKPRTSKKQAPQPDAAPAHASPPPIAALWEDGDICLYGLQINADESATIGEAHAQRLHKFLERVFGPTV